MIKKQADGKETINTVLTDTMPTKSVPGSVPMPTVVGTSSPAASQTSAIPEAMQLQPVRLDSFLASGFRADQAAGFALWAKNKKMGSRTIPEWWATYQDFLKRIV